MTLRPGDRVHLAGIGTGVIRDVRRGGQCVVIIKDMPVVAREDQLTLAEPPKRRRGAAAEDRSPIEADNVRPGRILALDLHGKTVAEAETAVDEFLNDALLAGAAEVHIIHGRSGGKVRNAAHARLRQIGAVRSFRLDARNAGVTIVTLT
jgi:DNA mismatch repair protein MutS2